jgi:hypothetical protein
MVNDITRSRLVAGWFLTVALISALVIALGVDVGGSTTALLLTLSIVPPGIILALWRGAPPPTVGQILYATNTRKEGRS